VAVLGGGYTGLATAYRLAGDHGLDTVVLEARAIGWGASGRNGGFAMMSLGKLSLQEREARWGLATARRIVRLGIDACERARLGGGSRPHGASCASGSTRASE
jgi:glycine/D-amino acid oxidase-like deaminating enzyme